MFASVFDGREGADDSLIIGNVLLLIERDIKVNLDANHSSQPPTSAVVPPKKQWEAHPNENSLPFQIDVCDCNLVGERHGVVCLTASIRRTIVLKLGPQ